MRAGRSFPVLTQISPQVKRGSPSLSAHPQLKSNRLCVYLAEQPH